MKGFKNHYLVSYSFIRTSSAVWNFHLSNFSSCYRISQIRRLQKKSLPAFVMGYSSENSEAGRGIPHNLYWFLPPAPLPSCWTRVFWSFPPVLLSTKRLKKSCRLFIPILRLCVFSSIDYLLIYCHREKSP